jgi:hypothetical protein
MPIRGSPNGAPLTLIHRPPAVDAIARNTWTPSIGMRWTPSIGTAGRHQSESVVAITRCAQYAQAFGDGRRGIPTFAAILARCRDAQRRCSRLSAPPLFTGPQLKTVRGRAADPRSSKSGVAGLRPARATLPPVAYAAVSAPPAMTLQTPAKMQPLLRASSPMRSAVPRAVRADTVALRPRL